MSNLRLLLICFLLCAASPVYAAGLPSHAVAESQLFRNNRDFDSIDRDRASFGFPEIAIGLAAGTLVLVLGSKLIKSSL